MEGALQDRRTLRRIALILLALALLAERAAGRSFPVRLLVLAILCRAEAVARTFVAGATATFVAEATVADWPCLDEPPAMRGLPVDAEILALRLRMLAAVLGVLSGDAGRSAGEEPRSGGAPGLPALLVVSLPAARRPPRPHDTS